MSQRKRPERDHRRIRRQWVVFLAVVALVAAACGGNGEPPAEAFEEAGTYRIGWASDRTSYLSFVDEPVNKGMEVAIKEINDAGGIAGRLPIELDVRDMRADPALGATVVQELVEEGVDFIVTTCDVDVSMPGAQLAAANGIPSMSSCGADASGPSQVPEGLFFLNVPGTLSQGSILAEYAIEQGHGTAFVHLSPDEGYTFTLARAFEKRFEELGGQVVDEARFNIGDTSFRATATRMVNSGADVIMTNTFPPDSIALLRDLERLGNEIPLLLVDGNDTPVIFEAGAQLELSTMTTYGGDRGEGSGIDEFNRLYEETFGGPPESLQTALGYDMIKVVAAAVEAAGTTEGTAVAEALANLENVEGATGLITYKDSPVGFGLPLKLYAITEFDLTNQEFVVIDNAFPEVIVEL